MSFKSMGIGISVVAGLFTIVAGVKDTFFDTEPIVVFIPETSEPQPDFLEPTTQSHETAQSKVSGERDALEPKTQPKASQTAKLPDIPMLVGINPEAKVALSPVNFELNEGVGKRICDDLIFLKFTVAKIGTRADTAIYLQSPKQTGRIEQGATLALTENCNLRLVRTGKKSQYFAVFELLENIK